MPPDQKVPEYYAQNTQFSEESFRGHYLNYFTFNNVEFLKCDLREIDARLATFIGCTFLDCPFDNANLQYTEFVNCRFLTNNTSDRKSVV